MQFVMNIDNNSDCWYVHLQNDLKYACHLQFYDDDISYITEIEKNKIRRRKRTSNFS